jgi:SPOR domain
VEHGDEPQGRPAPPAGGAAVPPALGAPPPSVVDRRVPCPRCGELAEPGQEVCLRCGALVGRGYRRPPSWRLPAALAALGVLLIGAGAGFGVAELTHHKSSEKKPISLTPKEPVTPPPPVTTPPPTTPTGPSGPSGPSGASGPSGPTSGGAAAGVTLTDWPAGKSGWTVVLATAKNRPDAEARAREAAGRSISAGVLQGSDYSSFGPDEWIAFMGQYDSRAAARRAGKAYAAKGFGGKPHKVTPKKK